MTKKVSIAIKADFIHFLNEDEMVFIPKGILWVEEGKVKKLTTHEEISNLLGL